MNLPIASSRSLSVLNRLLVELSWSGRSIRDYRKGGRGYENVLTAEAFQSLELLPRSAFLGAVVAEAHGAVEARSQLVAEIEGAAFTLLPGDGYLAAGGGRHKAQLSVQPDGIIESPGTYTILEAKRIRSSSFQAEQLAREYVLALSEAGDRSPILMLVLGDEPPVKVAKHGRMDIRAAITLHLESVLSRAEHEVSIERALAMVPEVVCWTTWGEISQIVSRQRDLFARLDHTVTASIDRIARSVIDSIAWHGPE